MAEQNISVEQNIAAQQRIAGEQKSYEYRLDFLYQSIAVYAGTLALYLLVRGELMGKQFPVAWQDPILGLLSLIILLSIAALVYNIVMRRRIIIDHEHLRFLSAARERVVERSDILSMQFGREPKSGSNSGARVVRIKLKSRRRAIRIHPLKFSNGSELLLELKEWAGPLIIARRTTLGVGRLRNSHQ